MPPIYSFFVLISLWYNTYEWHRPTALSVPMNAFFEMGESLDMLIPNGLQVITLLNYKLV